MMPSLPRLALSLIICWMQGYRGVPGYTFARREADGTLWLQVWMSRDN